MTSVFTGTNQREINFDATSFSTKESRLLDCQYGPNKNPNKGEMWLQVTRKIGCMAHVEVKAFNLYPEYLQKWMAMKYIAEVHFVQCIQIAHYS